MPRANIATTPSGAGVQISKMRFFRQVGKIALHKGWVLPFSAPVQLSRMFDPASISAALGSAKAILDLVKGANDAELAMRISGEIANLQGRLIDVQQSNPKYK